MKVNEKIIVKEIEKLVNMSKLQKKETRKGKTIYIVKTN